MKKCNLLSLIIFSAVFLTQQQAQALTLREAVVAATQNNPVIKKATESIKEYEYQSSLAFSPIFPNLSATATGTYKKDPLTLGAARFDGTPYNFYNINVHASQLVFGKGSIDYIQKNKYDVDIGNIEKLILVRDITAKVINTYYRVILSQNLYKILIHNEKLTQELLKIAEKRKKIGRADLLEVLQVKTELALIAPKKSEAENIVQISAAELINVLNQKDQTNEELSLEGDLDQIMKCLGHSINIPENLIPLELQKNVFLQKRLEKERSTLLGKHWPMLSLLGDVDRGSFVKSELLNSDATSWALGIRLSIPLFSGLSSVHERNIMGSRFSQLEREQDNLKNQIVLAQIKSKKNLETSIQTINFSTKTLGLAEASINEAQKNYKLGTTDIMQYLSVQKSYLEAESALNQAKYNYLVAILDYYISSALNVEELIKILEGNTK